MTFSFRSLLMSSYDAPLSSGPCIPLHRYTYVPLPIHTLPSPPSLDWFVVSKYVAAIIRTLVLGKIIILLLCCQVTSLTTMVLRFRHSLSSSVSIAFALFQHAEMKSTHWQIFRITHSSPSRIRRSPEMHWDGDGASYSTQQESASPRFVMMSRLFHAPVETRL